MNNKLKYILKEIKKANRLSILIFNFLYKLNVKSLNKTIYRLTEINETLTNLELQIELWIRESENKYE